MLVIHSYKKLPSYSLTSMITLSLKPYQSFTNNSPLPNTDSEPGICKPCFINSLVIWGHGKDTYIPIPVNDSPPEKTGPILQMLLAFSSSSIPAAATRHPLFRCLSSSVSQEPPKFWVLVSPTYYLLHPSLE